MPFVFVKEPVVWWPVKVRVPADGGATADQVFHARFRILAAPAFDRAFAGGANALLRAVTLGWRELLQPDGSDLEFSPATLEMLLELPFIQVAMADAYAEAMAGGPRKN
jgi:hypothetical protein